MATAAGRPAWMVPWVAVVALVGGCAPEPEPGVDAEAPRHSPAPIELAVLPSPPDQGGDVMRGIGRVRLWRNDIIVSWFELGSDGSTRGGLWRLDESTGLFVPLVDDAGDSIVAVAEGTQIEAVVVRTGDALVLRYPGGEAQERRLPLEADADLVLSASEHHAFVFLDDRILQVAHDGRATWPARGIEGVGELTATPAAVLVDGSTLLVGYDLGEWGGGAFAYPLRADGIATPPVEIEGSAMTNVQAIVRDARGRIWVASGLAHLGAANADLGLLTPDKRRLTSVLGRDVKLPRRSEVTGCAVLEDTGTIVLVGTSLGLAAYANGAVRSLWNGPFAAEGTLEGVVEASLTGAVVAHGGSLYVDAGLLGLIRFEAGADGRWMPVAQYAWCPR